MCLRRSATFSFCARDASGCRDAACCRTRDSRSTKRVRKEERKIGGEEGGKNTLGTRRTAAVSRSPESVDARAFNIHIDKGCALPTETASALAFASHSLR